MSYAVTNPPAMQVSRVGASGALWYYTSTDAAATVAGANYFTNGLALGMRVGDVLHNVESDNSYLLTIHSVTAVTSSGATVSSAI